MIKKVINTLAQVVTVWLAAEAVRQVWKEIEKEEKKENK